MEGTITWIAVDKEPPPPKHSNTRFTKYVLLLMPTHEIVRTRGVWLSTGFVGWEHSGNRYEPTHFAYINYPTT